MPTVAAWTGILGALILALNISISPLGYVLFTCSSACWMHLAAERRDRPLLMMNTVFLFINILGMIRWLRM